MIGEKIQIKLTEQDIKNLQPKPNGGRQTKNVTADGTLIIRVDKRKKGVRKYFCSYNKDTKASIVIGDYLEISIKEAIRLNLENNFNGKTRTTPANKLSLTDYFMKTINAASLSDRTKKSYTQCFIRNISNPTSRKDPNMPALARKPAGEKYVMEVEAKDIMPIIDYIKSKNNMDEIDRILKIIALVKKRIEADSLMDRKAKIALQTFPDPKIIRLTMSAEFKKSNEQAGHPYIQGKPNLKKLIENINELQPSSVKNALIFGLITGLRCQTLLSTNTDTLKFDEEKNIYYLYYPKECVKKGAEDGYLGIPEEVADWLKRLISKESRYIFNSPRIPTKPISEGGMRKALTLITFDEVYGGKKGNRVNRKHIVIHSFRKILATYVTEYCNGKFDEADCDRVLWHTIGKITKTYNKSTGIYKTNEVITWWLNFLKENGLIL